MKYYGRASEVSQRIVDAFRAGNVPKTLATVFIKRDGAPCNGWSWSNQMLVALAGSADARGFRQWRTVKRHVSKGAKAVYILIPLVGKKDTLDENGEPQTFLYGFKSAPVFRFEDTAGEPLPGIAEAERFVDALPLISVARSWGLSVQTYNGEGAKYDGFYQGGKGIALGVKNLSVWAHELVHAAEFKLRKGLKGGQDPAQEIVAELGASTLLEMLGKPVDADRGGAWEYVKGYASKAGKEPVSICQTLLNRVGKAISLILETAEELTESVDAVRVDAA